VLAGKVTALFAVMLDLLWSAVCHLRFHSNISTVCPGGQLCTNSTAGVLICAVQLSGGANSPAPGLLAGFWGGQENRKKGKVRKWRREWQGRNVVQL